MYGRLVEVNAQDGVRLHGFLTVPKHPSEQVWILVHGVNGSFYGSSLLSDIAVALTGWGHSALLVNTRGHDLASFSSGSPPSRIGSMFEHIEDGLLDLTAWVDFAKREGFEHVGIAAHSLGAVKAAYAYAHGLARTQRFIALSPPRLNTGTLSDDPKKGALFRAHIELAQSLVEQGKANEIIKVRFPLANWVSAGTFLDKYGSNDKYDYLKVVEQVPVPVLWIFGEQETRDGSANFRNADERLMDSIVSSNLARQSVRVVASADHSYRETRVELCDCIQAWLES